MSYAAGDLLKTALREQKAAFSVKEHATTEKASAITAAFIRGVLEAAILTKRITPSQAGIVQVLCMSSRNDEALVYLEKALTS